MVPQGITAARSAFLRKFSATAGQWCKTRRIFQLDRPGRPPYLSQMTKIHLIHGDCIAGMKKLARNSVDAVVTSPPYNIGIKYSSYADRLPLRKYMAWSRRWMKQLHNVLKEDGSFFLNVGGSLKSPLLPHQLLLLAIQDGWVLQNTIHWVKSITIQKDVPVSAGHFKPVPGERFLNNCHEYVFHLTKTGDVRLNRLAVGVPYADKSNITRWGHTAGKDKRCRGNTWFVPYPTIQKKKSHPATFPTLLAQWCFQLHGNVQVGLDPFVGIGHAAHGAKAAGVAEFYGFDLDKEYLAEGRASLGL